MKNSKALVVTVKLDAQAKRNIKKLATAAKNANSIRTSPALKKKHLTGVTSTVDRHLLPWVVNGSAIHNRLGDQVAKFRDAKTAALVCRNMNRNFPA